VGSTPIGSTNFEKAGDPPAFFYFAALT